MPKKIESNEESTALLPDNTEKNNDLIVLEQELLKKQKELIAFEKELSIKNENLKDLEKLRDNLEHAFKLKDAELNKEKERIITLKSKDIAEKETKIKELSLQINNLNNKIQELNIKSASKQKDIVLELESYKASQLEEINKNLHQVLTTELKTISQNSKDLFSNLSSNLNLNLKNLNAEYEKLIETYDRLAKTKIEQNDVIRKELLKNIEDFEKKSQEYYDLEITKKSLSQKEASLNRKETLFENILQKRVEETQITLVTTLNAYKSEIEKLKSKFEEVFHEKQTLVVENQTLRSTGVQSLEQELNQIRERNAELEQKYKAFTSIDFNQLKSKANRVDELMKLNNELIERESQSNVMVQRLKADKEQSIRLAYENELLKTDISLNKTYLTRIKDELESLRSRVDDASKGTIASETIETPYKEFTTYVQDDGINHNEITWLDNIIQKCKESGYSFSKRLVYSFHTSLKTSSISPLTVLAGISGTGKSKLPQLYSRFGGLYFLSLPVQPDWDSPQSLFGYFNSIEKRFNATSLLRVMVSFQKDKNDSEKIFDLSDRVLLVLLDEMNLAHVELYFADLLSKLEEQRGDNKSQKFEIDLGASMPKYDIKLTKNILWSGTMNEDETTKALSDKVVDRGNILSFPRPQKFMRYINKELSQRSPMIKRELWETWNSIKLKPSMTTEISQIIDIYSDAVMQINLALRFANRALGHRVWQSIENYIFSHPIVIKENDNLEKLKLALKFAFEEAIVLKVVPKLRGIELEKEMLKNCLNPIREIIDKHANGLLDDFDIALNNQYSPTNTFIWDSAKYLEIEFADK
jgi:hypothetical protein